MTLGGGRWWTTKIRQVSRHLRARVGESERAGLAAWTTPAERIVFDRMTVADRRHGLDVVATLRAHGVTDRDVLVAGLLHDAGKGRTGLWPRIVYALGQAYGPWVWTAAGWLPGMARSVRRLQEHPERSAALASAAGCSPRTVALILQQDDPRDPEFGNLLKLADEAN